MLDVDLGFTTNVLTAGTSLRQRTYPDPPSLAAYFERLLARLAPLVPGGRVAAADWWPLQEPRPRDVSVSGSSGASSAPAGLLAVTPGYFDVLGIRLVDGRGFSDHDRVGGEMVAIASLSLARRLWPDARAVGQVLRIPAGEDANAPDATTVTIVGVVRDVKQTHADQQLHDLYLPFLQRPDRFAFVYLGGPGATALPVATLREEAVAAGSEAAIGQPRVLSDVVAETRAPALSLAGLLAGLAVAASVLALVGLYGVVAYTVRQREREIAMRMALGADRRRVVSLFVAYGWRIVLPGLAIGVAAAFALGRVLESQLFSVSIADPAVLATAVVSLTLGALAAVWWPARRAAALDPATLLRSE
jgi:putative ABC transport system permease protein